MTDACAPGLRVPGAPPGDARLAAFLLASVVVHLCAVGLLLAGTPIPQVGAAPEPLRASLALPVPAPSNAIDARRREPVKGAVVHREQPVVTIPPARTHRLVALPAASRAIPPQAPPPRAGVAPVGRPAADSVPAVIAAGETSVPERGAPPATSSAEPVHRAVADLLHAAIDRHKRYPRIARRMGQQGNVTLAFRLHPDGRISGLRVYDGSGYSALDHAALDAVEAVAPFAAAADYLREAEPFQVRVRFVLPRRTHG